MQGDIEMKFSNQCQAVLSLKLSSKMIRDCLQNLEVERMDGSVRSPDLKAPFKHFCDHLGIILCSCQSDQRNYVGSLSASIDVLPRTIVKTVK